MAIVSEVAKPVAPTRTAVGRGIWALLDQAVVSVANFVIMILMARTLGPSAFGTFSIVYSLLWLVESLQSGLLTQPHNVLGVTRQDEDYPRYTSSTALGQTLLVASFSLVGLIAWAGAYSQDWAVAPLLLATIPAMAAWQFHEFARRVFYTERRIADALVSDVIRHGGASLAVVTWWWQGGLSGTMALYAVAAFSALAAVWSLWRLQESFAFGWSAEDLQKNWEFGKWLAASSLVGQWLAAQLFVYLAAAMVGVAAAGVLKAGHLIFGPTRLIANALRSILPNSFSRTLSDEGAERMHRDLQRTFSVAVPLLGAYCLLVAVLAGPLLQWLYGDKYAGNEVVVMLLALAAFLGTNVSILGAALRARRQTKDIFYGWLISTLVALPIGATLTALVGVAGAAVGMIMAQLSLGLVLWNVYRRTVRWEPSTGDLPQSDASCQRSSVRANADEDAARGNQQATGQMLLRIFATLDEMAIPYCVLHGYEQYPQHAGSDVDCVIAAEAVPRRLAGALNAGRDRLGGTVIQWYRGGCHGVTLAAHEDPEGPSLLQLDFSTDYDFNGRFPFYSGEELLARRKRYKTFWILEPSLEFGTSLLRRVIKRRLESSHAKKLSELYRQDPVGCGREVRRLWGGRSAQLIERAARESDWDVVRAGIGRLRAEALARAVLSRPSVTARKWWRGAQRALRRCVRPCNGFHVLFLGPDGAGKTSVISAVSDEFGGVFSDTSARSFPPRLLKRPTGVPGQPHAAPLRSRLHSCVRAILYWGGYYGPGYYLTVHRDLSHSKLVCHDRHLIDACVDPRRYGYSGPSRLIRWIWRLVPQPDLVILLDAPPQTIYRRKQELPVTEIERQQVAYRTLVEAMPDACIVDASQPLAGVVADVSHQIVQRLAARVSRDLQLEPQS